MPAMDDAARFEQARNSFLAGLQAQGQGRWDEAETHYRTSLAALPGRPSTLTNLGALLLQQGRPAEALLLLDQALAAEPRNVQALAHRGDALLALGHDAEALAAFETTLALEPLPRARLRRAECLARLQRQAEALPLAEALTAGEPGWAEAWRLRGQLLLDLQRPAEAAPALAEAARLGDELAAWLAAGLARAQDAAVPARPPAGYVEALFDGYAADFDRHLVDELGYDAPARLAQGLGTARFAEALDLGCGTGLVGRALRGRVDRLVGIDLSAAMLERARAGGDYTELHRAELLAYLDGLAPASLDLVLAADVLIYLGELDPLFAAVRRVLRPGGVFAFSIEQVEGTAGVELRPTARYAHAAPLLHTLAARHGLVVEHEEAGTLRLEQREPVAGRYLWLRG